MSDSAQEVGLVVVSHSRALAQAAVVLAEEMLHGRSLRIEVAAGLDETTLGTDAVSISAAIERADGPAGVVVLMDLGSAVLSAELALDLLNDPTARDRVTLSPAPIVEGLVVAAVAAAGGASRAEVAAEARDALMGKASHLAEPTTGVVAEPRPEEVVGVFTVQNAHGLHARPAARLVSEVRTLDATVHLRNLTTGAGPVPAASLSRVATLAALHGHEVEVLASGPQAQEAVEHLLTLATRRFDEGDEDVAEIPRTTSVARSHGDGPLPASPGIAIGPVRHLSAALPGPDQLETEPAEPAADWRRIVEAVATARREIERVRVMTAREVGAAEASIFDAHLSLLADTEMLADVKARLAQGSGAVAAWSASVAEVEAQWAALPDPYLRERAADVHAVGEQVRQALTGKAAATLTAAGVLVADDLTPAETAALDLDLVSGVVLAHGSPTSHAAILARARDIPVIVSAGRDVLGLAEGTTVVVDGSTGELHVTPSDDLLERYRRRALEAAKTHAEQLAQSPAARHLPRRHDLHRGGQPGVRRRRPRGTGRRGGRCRAGADRVHLPRPVDAAHRRGAAGPLRRHRGGDGRTARHAAHP